MTFTPKTPAFEKAIKESRNLKAKPDNDELLEVENPLTPLLTSLAYTNNRRAPQLYSLFKQGSQDPSFAEAPKPGMFDLTGKAKYNAWKQVEEDGVSAKDAQEKYVEKVNSLKEKYGFGG
ncbi:MAG: hypothetical protein L6R40_008507 [Gallowayella cf. fulva]|nr:MAG: hypothetical protein L6R40_008507 [Xanthomendoza cf. fulva]